MVSRDALDSIQIKVEAELFSLEKRYNFLNES